MRIDNLFPIIAIDDRIRAIKTEVEQLKSQRNLASKEIGEKNGKGNSLFFCRGRGVAGISK